MSAPTLETTADSKSKQRKRRKGRYFSAANREPRPRSIIDQEMKKDPEAPLKETTRWWDYP